MMKTPFDYLPFIHKGNMTMNNNIMNSKRIIKDIKLRRIVSALVVLAFLVTGTHVALADTGVSIDADKTVVYSNVSAGSVVGNPDAFNGKNYAVVGRIKNVSADGFSFTLLPEEDGDTGITCTLTVGIYSMVAHTEFDETGSSDKLFKVLGQVQTSSKGITLAAEYVFEADGKPYEYTWTLKGGREFRTNETYNRSLGGVMHYEIPAAWKTVEEELPNVEGYQYRLNELDRSGAPESLFIFYVGNEHLEEASDKDKTKEFCDAIVKNIMGSVIIRGPILSQWFERDMVRRDVQADYGKLSYYTGSFTDENNNDFSKHRVEFIFLPRDNTDEGVQALLYVYPVTGGSQEHKEEILYVMRSMFP